MKLIKVDIYLYIIDRFSTYSLMYMHNYRVAIASLLRRACIKSSF